MVTKKTRLMSALLAVLMLTSLFTAFALPAVAEGATEKAAIDTSTLDQDVPVEWPATLYPYEIKDQAPDGTKDFAITDAADWKAAIAVGNSGDQLAGITFWFTNDIDFDIDGDGIEDSEYINPLCPSASFNGKIYGQGHVVKNVYISKVVSETTNVAFLGTCLGSTKNVVRDLGIASGSITGYSTGTTSDDDVEVYVGAFAAQNRNIVYLNCWNAASVTAATATGSAYGTGVASAFGRFYHKDATMMAIINCFNIGTISTTNNTTRAAGLFDWGAGAPVTKTEEASVDGTYIYAVNSFNAGKITAKYHTTALSYRYSISEATRDNVWSVYTKYLAINNGGATGAITEGVLADKAELTGELAWRLNQNYADPATSIPKLSNYISNPEQVYWTTTSAGTVPGTVDNQTVKISLVYDGEEKAVTYVNRNETLDLSTVDHGITSAAYAVADADSSVAAMTGSSIKVTGVPTTDLTVTVNLTSTVLQYGELNDAIALYAGKDTAYYTDADGTVLTDEYNTIVAEMENYNQDQIDAAADRLGEFSFNKEQIVPISEFDTYKDVVVNIGVASVADLETVAAKMSEITTAHTLCVTADITFENGYTGTATDLKTLKASIVGKKADGTNAVIENLVIEKNWLGEYSTTKSLRYGGARIENITFKNCKATNCDVHYDALLMGSISQKVTFKNVVMDGCEVTSAFDGSGGQGVGLMLGRPHEAVDFINVTVKGCTLTRDGEALGEYSNSGLLAGATAGAATLTNVLLVDNTIMGEETGNARGIAFGEITAAFTANNVGIFNTAVHESGVQAALVGAFKTTGAVSINNVITANNGTQVGFVAVANASQVINISNVYTDAPVLVSGSHTSPNNTAAEGSSVTGNVVETSVITSGAAAWALNNAGVEQKWTMNGTTPVFDNETNRTIRITLKFDGMETYLYANADAENIALGTDGTYTVETGAADVLEGNLLDITGTTDVVVAVEADGIGAHTHTDHMEYTDHEDGTHTPYCDYEVPIDGRLFVCDYEEDAVACSNFTYALVTDSIDAETHAHQSIATCDDCGYTAAAADCTAGYDEAVTTAPGCETEGVKTFTCKNTCGYSYTAPIAATGHAEKYVPNGDGTHNVICENENNAVLESNVTCAPAADAVWTQTKAPSMEEFGAETAPCATCGGTVTRQIAKLIGIDASAELSADEKTVTVTVGLLNNTAVTSMGLEITYDQKAMTLTNEITGGTITSNADGKATVTVTAVDADVVLSFAIATDGENITASNKGYTITVEPVDAKDAEDAPVAVEEDTATFTITKGSDYMKGDLTGDKIVDIVDAVLLLRYINNDLPAAYEGKINAADADLYIDTEEPAGTVNTKDVVYLLQYLNGWIAEL